MRSEFGDDPGVVVVSGAGGAVGSALCGSLLESGVPIAMIHRSPSSRVEDLLERAREARVEASDWRVDLLDEDATMALPEMVLGRHGRVGGLVHAAGPRVPQKFLSAVEPAEMRRHVEGEVVAFFNFVQPFILALRNGSGAVVAVTTVASRSYPIRDGLSSGPKAAIDSICRALAAEEGRYGVRFNCVGPGILDEGMAEHLFENGEMNDRDVEAALTQIALKRFGKAQEVADAVHFLLSDRASYITGQYIDVDGGYSI